MFPGFISYLTFLRPSNAQEKASFGINFIYLCLCRTDDITNTVCRRRFSYFKYFAFNFIRKIVDDKTERKLVNKNASNKKENNKSTAFTFS